MKLKMALVAVGLMAAAPAFSESHGATGDAAKGEKAFRQCVSCHVVVNEAGETLAGKAAKTGPNLYGVPGATAGEVEGFRFSKLLKAANEKGIMFNEATFTKFVMDPSGAMSELTGEKGRSKMSFKLRKEKDAINIYAYLFSLSAE